MTLSPRPQPPERCLNCNGVGRHLSTCSRPEVTGLWPVTGKWTCLGCNSVQHGGFVLVDGKRRCLGCGAHAAARTAT